MLEVSSQAHYSATAPSVTEQLVMLSVAVAVQSLKMEVRQLTHGHIV